MVRNNHDAIRCFQGRQHRMRFEAPFIDMDSLHVWIRKRDRRPQAQQYQDYVECRRLADIVDISLIGGAEDVNMRASNWLGDIIQSVLYFLDDKLGHTAVDVPSQLDKTC